MHDLTAAHKTLPFGSRVLVRNLDNQKEIEVRINDHGPHARGRVIDLSRAAAAALGMLEQFNLAAMNPQDPKAWHLMVEASRLAFADRNYYMADPDFVNKIRAGDLEDIRWCVACNQGCIERLMFEMKSATCTFNPECGRENRDAPALLSEKKRLCVVGSGPAGLSAALAAMERGFDVEVFEKESGPGGQLQSATQPPHKEIFRTWMVWALRRLSRGGVKIHCGREVTAELLKALRPDALILAGIEATAPV